MTIIRPCYGLDILRLLVLEAEMLDLPRSRIHAIQGALREKVEDILQVLAGCCIFILIVVVSVA